MPRVSNISVQINEEPFLLMKPVIIMTQIHRTKYKNILKTTIYSVASGVIIYIISHLIFKLEEDISFKICVIGFIGTFILIGRKIIVRHTIHENLSVSVDFLLQPNYQIKFNRSEVKSIEFKIVDYGRYGTYEKGVIIFQNDKNYHRDYITFSLEDEVKWFWSNFNYPNLRKKTKR